MDKDKNKSKPQSFKQQRPVGENPPPLLSEIIYQDYEANLNELLDMQKKINIAWENHPVYQEFHRSKETKRQYKRLQKEHKLAIRHASSFYRISKREYKQWLRVLAEPSKLIRSAENIGRVLGRFTSWLRSLID